jgi:hypothetical protein
VVVSEGPEGKAAAHRKSCFESYPRNIVIKKTRGKNAKANNCTVNTYSAHDLLATWESHALCDLIYFLPFTVIVTSHLDGWIGIWMDMGWMDMDG